ncbi:hypothetical protein TWF696_007984 [Orbilia brochopaga]|uniref:D-serine dehydratase n=1 Tax=Orbilia brochopaga TaxID=3140254 RepID=A0AAV9UMQ3_9PEZI
MNRTMDEAAVRKDALHPLLSSYIGNHRTSLPTPSLCLSLPTIKRNCDIFLKSLHGLDIGFRAHVKTHKTIEVTRMELGSDYHAVVTSTIREIRGLKPLIDDGTVTDVLYGLPPAASYIPTLSSLSREIPNLRLIVDHVSQLEALTRLPPLCGKPWSIFIKIDCGYHRAGVSAGSPDFIDLLSAVLSSKSVDIYGFYAHAGDSYGASNEKDSVKYLKCEIQAVLEAVRSLINFVKPGDIYDEDVDEKPYVLSVGATPTAHVISILKEEGEGLFDIPKNCKIEVHAGNFPFNDLQQLATGVVPDPDPDVPGSSSLACTVNAEVVSIYEGPWRNEALINAGVLAIGREPGQLPGYARIRGLEKFIVGRVSQEHGVLTFDKRKPDTNLNFQDRDPFQEDGVNIHEVLKIGDRVVLDVQHACVTAACHDWYFILNEEDIVTDVWYPWRGWM